MIQSGEDLSDASSSSVMFPLLRNGSFAERDQQLKTSWCKWYRVAKTYRMPHLHPSFSTKKPLIIELLWGKWPIKMRWRPIGYLWLSGWCQIGKSVTNHSKWLLGKRSTSLGFEAKLEAKALMYIYYIKLIGLFCHVSVKRDLLKRDLKIVCL